MLNVLIITALILNLNLCDMLVRSLNSYDIIMCDLGGLGYGEKPQSWIAGAKIPVNLK